MNIETYVAFIVSLLCMFEAGRAHSQERYTKYWVLLLSGSAIMGITLGILSS